MIYGENKEALEAGETFPNGKVSHMECCKRLKTEALTHTLNGTWPRYRLNLQTGKYEQDTNTAAYTGVIVGAVCMRKVPAPKSDIFLQEISVTIGIWTISRRILDQFKTDFAPGKIM